MVKLAGHLEKIFRTAARFLPSRPRVGGRSRSRTLQLVEALKRLSALRSGRSHRTITEISCSEYFGVRDEALRAHATQVDPNGFFFVIPLEWRQRLWPTEKFKLARSRVATSGPETDLFAGITLTTD